MNRFYIVGTDTGVGKTVFSTILMQYFYLKGFNPFYFKPFQTGCPFPYHPESDAFFVYKNVDQLRKKDPAFSVGYCFEKPKAPLFAAMNEKKQIDMNWIMELFKKRSRGYNPVIIEGSGGLLVPVTEKLLVIDTVQIFKAKPILIARAGLGTINHTLLSLEAFKIRGIKPVAVVFIDNENTPEDMIKENIKAIEMFSKEKVAGVIRISDFFLGNRIPEFLDLIFDKLLDCDV